MSIIAFAGLGAMGLPMARHLLRAGHTVRGIDPNPTALATLETEGGQPSNNPAAACQGAEFLILMVVNAAQAEQVLFTHGALAALPPESWADLEDRAMKKFGEWCATAIAPLMACKLVK